MLTRETKQQVDLQVSDYKDELGNEDEIMPNVRMTPVRKVVRKFEHFISRMKDRMMPERRPYWQG